MSIEFPNILALDSTGSPQRWITYEDAAFYKAKDLILWSIGENFTLHGGYQRISGLQSTLKIDTIIAIKGKSKYRAEFDIPKLTNKALFRRDKNICAYCANDFYNGRLTRDHIIPKIQKGVDKWENVVSSCPSCNKRKGGRTPEEANMPLVYIPYKPCVREHLILMNRNILACQMEFLSSKIKNPHTRVFD